MNAHATLLLALGATACSAGAAAPAAAVTSPPAEAATAPPKPVPLTNVLASARVWDERGVAAPCGPPATGCAPLPAPNEFLDRCRLAGFRVLQCSCEARCTGDVIAATRHYDASGQPKECPAARADCSPPPPGAAFQDACAERGFRLDTCGCEWLCSGDFKRAP